MAVTSLKTKFGKLIKDYLRNADIRQKDLAVRLDVSAAAVSQMIHGKIVPNQKQLDLICEMLSLDRARAFELNSMLSRIRTGAENMLSPFNQLVFALRCQRGLSLRQLANLSGVPASHLKVFETCFEAVPTLDEAEKIAPILGCTSAALLQSAGVGGLTGNVADAYNSAFGEVAERGEASYRAEQPIPLLNLVDLDAYDGKESFASFARRRATRAIELPGVTAEEPVAVQAAGRDLALGLPGSLLVLVADRRPEGYREMNLCRDVSGKYLIQEMRRGRRKAFRLAGSRRVFDEVAWELPVLEITVRPLKAGGK